MTPSPLEALLDKLCQGDAAAAEEVFRTYEPCLRLIVRRQLPAWLRSKFDSVDIVQSVWADLVDGFRQKGWHFDDTARLRAFLIKATRHRFLSRFRQHRRAGDLEQPLESADGRLASREPAPDELAGAEDVWQQLLGLCPPEHRNLLEWKRQGLALEEIARRTGLHPSSVRRILYDLSRRFTRLRRRQDEAPGPTA
jgi:RNA polymerase sigma-70 factor (ECF subfamily)